MHTFYFPTIRTQFQRPHDFFWLLCAPYIYKMHLPTHRQNTHTKYKINNITYYTETYPIYISHIDISLEALKNCNFLKKIQFCAHSFNLLYFKNIIYPHINANMKEETNHNSYFTYKMLMIRNYKWAMTFLCNVRQVLVAHQSKFQCFMVIRLWKLYRIPAFL